MYTTCIFCHGDLGRNDALEHFTVGRRLAYDEARGRLWVVCRRCQRWNLSPTETRWEAIEEAERAFRAVRMRIAAEPSMAEATMLEGVAALRALAKLLPHANLTGAGARGVRRAVGVIESASSLDAVIQDAAGKNSSGNALTRLPAAVRLALEMVVHDDAERRALEGELAELERLWREAEQIAGIADALLAPADLDARLAALRRAPEPGPSATGPA
jgi:hypothetical protein